MAQTEFYLPLLSIIRCKQSDNMNIEKYARDYSNFHNAVFNIVDNMVILPFTIMEWDSSKVLRLTSFDKIESYVTKPLIRAFKAYFKKDTICTVFLSKDASCSLLFGNEKLVIPDSRGSCKIYATPFFVRDPKTIENHPLVTRSPFENVFFYDNMILYLDEFDVPCPGGNYFHEKTTGSEYYRLCFLSSQPPQLTEWRNHTLRLPFYSKPAKIRLSSFLNLEPINDLPFPDSGIRSTAMLERNKNLIQDILKTYVNNGGFLHNIGLFLEYPLRGFVAISINGNEPKKVLHVRSPYDRYIEYDHVPAVSWTRVLFDTDNIPLDLYRVVIDSTILGYCYRDTFLCLSDPMLEILPSENLNTKYLLNVADEETLFSDPHRLTVIDTYRYDCHHDLHRVKHCEIPYELWCLSKNNNSKNCTTTKRTTTAPDFVRQWLTFYDQNKEKRNIQYGDLNIVKLALILARHKICFTLKTSNSKGGVFYERGKDITFRLDQGAVEYLNDIRLDEGQVVEENNDNCTVM